MKRSFRYLAYAAMLVVLAGTYLILVPSCTGGLDPTQRSALLAQSEATQRDIAAAHDRAMAEFTAAQSSGDVAKAKKAQDALTLLDRLKTLVDSGHDVFQASTAPDGTINLSPASVAIGGAVGGPIGAGLAVGLPLLFGLVQTLRKRQADAQAQTNLAAAVSLVKGIDAVSLKDPSLNSSLNAAWPTVEAEMTPTAKALVAEHSVT